MRNNILVRNGVYIKSTQISRRSMQFVSNAVPSSNEENLKVKNKSYDMFVSGQDTVEVIANPTTVLVQQLSSYQEYRDIKHISTYARKIDKEVTEYVELEDTCYTNVHVVGGSVDGIVVFDATKQEYTVSGAVFYIQDKRDKHLDILLYEVLEFDIISNKVPNTVNMLGTVNYAQVQKEFPLESSKPVNRIKGALVTKQEMIDFEIKEEIAIAVKSVTHQEGYESAAPLEVDVINVCNQIEAGTTGSGGDLQSLTFTIQQMAFFEFKLKYKENKVKEIFNLPAGLFFDLEQQRIIGTPIQSGRYAFSVIFEDNSNMDGVINVPKINREL